MKTIRFLLVFSVMLLFSILVFAQDSTGGGGGGTGFSLPAWLVTAAAILLGVYEVVIRYIPTIKNYSILGWVIKLIQFVAPNRNSQGKDHA